MAARDADTKALESIAAAPPAVRRAAAEGLRLRDKFNRGGTTVGIARGKQLAGGKTISRQDLGKMVSYFARHAVDKQGEDWGNKSRPSAGYIAWLLWGGDPGRRWAESLWKKHE